MVIGADVAAQPQSAGSLELERIPLQERVRLLTGATSWTLHPLPAAGLRSMVLSDGPIGVRGVDEDARPSAQLPSPSALAATWDPELAGRLGTLLAAEARRKGVDMILAPVVNLQRTPVGGRHFEFFSEDPLLTARLAGAQIRAVQSEGVAMCVKHFVGNESETDRTSYLARIPVRALREVYLAPFEHAVRDAGVWAVMSAYNGLDDGVQAAPTTEHGRLILQVLKREWGFDGVVVSDWLAANTTVESALGGLDLVMPGPDGPWGDRLVAAVESGLVPEACIDEKVARIVRLGERVGAVGRPASGIPDESGPTSPATRALLAEAVARSIVVLRNHGDRLPLAPGSVGRIAVIGPNAVDPFIQGGGSASVRAPHAVLPADAIRDAFPASTVELHQGVSGRRYPVAIDPALVSTPDGLPGYRLQYLDAAGGSVGEPSIVSASESWNRGAPAEAVSAEIVAEVALTGAGVHRIGLGVSGAHRIRFDDDLVSESATIADHGVILDSSANVPAGPIRSYVLGDEPRTVRVTARLQVVDANAYGRFTRFVLRHDRADIDEDALLRQAVDAAAAADLAVVIVGTNEEAESEGWDRPGLALPGRQDELVRRVHAANPDTIVIVNAGAPVILPWLDEVPAVLWWWLPGQEAGAGLAAALTGRIEPSGRLPWTLPASADDVPVPDGLPDEDGYIDYTEGIHVGYRGWDLMDRTPARPFGFGLGYGTAEIVSAEPAGDAGTVTVTAAVRNTGARATRTVVQAYLSAEASGIERPVRWLAGFAAVDVAQGETVTVRIGIPRRAFEVWDASAEGWTLPDGDYRLGLGLSSRDLPVTVALRFTGGRPAL